MGPEVVLIALIAIIGGLGSETYIRAMKLKSKKGLSSGDREKILALEKSLEENKKLNERVKNLEYIITSLDKEILQLHAPGLNEDPAKEVKQLTQEIKKAKES